MMYDNSNRCVICNSEIPEGTIVCYHCQKDPMRMSGKPIHKKKNIFKRIRDFIKKIIAS